MKLLLRNTCTPKNSLTATNYGEESCLIYKIIQTKFRFFVVIHQPGILFDRRSRDIPLTM